MVTLGVLSKDFPWRLFIKVVVVVLLGAIVAGIFLYLSSEVFVGGSYLQGLRRLASAKTEIVRNSLIIYLFTGLLIMIGLGLLTLFYSHRIAGPLFRLGKEARRIAQGDLTVHVRLRSTDAIHPLADSMNEMVDAYRQRVIQVREKLDHIKEVARTLEEKPSDGPELDERIDRLSKEVKSLQEALRELKL